MPNLLKMLSRKCDLFVMPALTTGGYNFVTFRPKIGTFTQKFGKKGIIFTEDNGKINEFQLNIDQDIKFIDLRTFDVHESYQINRVNITSKIGYLKYKEVIE